MEFHQLRYFLAIADQSSISRASEELHISQSALSVALKDLERELGFPLFDRNGRRLVINDYGRYFAVQARSALRTLNDACLAVSEDVSRRLRTVSCATNLTMGPIITQLMRAYRKQRPEVIVRIAHKSSDMFRHASPDIEFFGTRRELKENENLVKVLSESFVAVFAPGSLSFEGPVRLADMGDAPYVTTGPGHMMEIVADLFAESGFKPNVICELQVYCDVLNMVRAGEGFTIGPSRTWLDGAEGLDVRQIADAHQIRNIYATIPEHIDPSPAAKEFLEFLRTDGQKVLNGK